MKVAIILPTYNERENIISLLEELHAVTAKISGFTFSYLVVDDTSPDGTGALVREFQKKQKDVYLLVGKKEGLGSALIKGMEYAIKVLKAEYLVQMDADHSHDPQKLIEFFHKIRNGADFVIGSRYIPGGSIPDNWGVHRKIFSVVGNSIVRFGLGRSLIHDWTGGFRAHHIKYFEQIHTVLKPFSGYVFQIAFLHQAMKVGAHIVEVPIHFTDRKYGRSKIAPAEYIKNVLIYVFRARFAEVRRGSFPKFLVVGAVGFAINTIMLELLIHKFDFHPGLASAVGAECAIISNFFLNNGWTFQSKKAKGKDMFPKLFKFNLSSLGAMALQAATVTVGTHFFGEATYRIFYMFGVGFGLIWNYTMYSRVIWKTKSHE